MKVLTFIAYFDTMKMPKREERKMLEIQAISHEYGKLYSATAEKYAEATEWAERFLTYRAVDTVTIINHRKIERVKSKLNK